LRRLPLIAIIAALVVAPIAGAAAKRKVPTSALAPVKVDGAYFLSAVRPVLIGRCLGCHGGEEPQAKLDLSTREAILKGGARPIVKPGSSGQSILMHRVVAGTMPPKGKLPAAETAILRRWVDAGMPWSGGRLELNSITTATRAGLDWWSLQPLRAVPPPATPASAGPAVPPHSRAIDAFVRARLVRAGLDFSPAAPRETYIRRVTYDLHGLPPSREEIAAFAADRTPDAFERLVDRLLASPRFGERFGRRWLDVVRFAESDGYEHDLPRLKAWPYRDWVIATFNSDMPYDQFVREQLAGDALHPEDPKAGVPTSFLVAGGYDAVGAKQAAENFRAEVRQDELEDMIGATTQVLLGMTAQCARCHDHKFDPIPQSDYYRLQAVFAGAQHYGPAAKIEYYGVRSDAPPKTWLLKRGQVTSKGPEVTPGALSALRSLSFELPTAPAVSAPPFTKGGPGGVPSPGAKPSAEDRARRLEFARWVTDPQNPMTARVMTNRVWGWLFGHGIVDTPNDLGFNGDRPSHPELLEWLAASFSGVGQRDNGATRQSGGDSSIQTLTRSSIDGSQVTWSIKRLVRAMVLSRTYRQSSAGNAQAEAKDAGNRLLWRFNARRLESEEIRDTILTAAGKLNLKMGGPGFQLFTWKENAGALYETIDPEGDEYCRRAIYRTVVRGSEDPLLSSLDCPDASNTTPKRQATTTATQALSLLNNSFVDRQSRAFAQRLQRDAPTGVSEQVRLSYALALGREPSAAELPRAAAFAERHGIAAWTRVLFNTSEFLYVE